MAKYKVNYEALEDVDAGVLAILGIEKTSEEKIEENESK